MTNDQSTGRDCVDKIFKALRPDDAMNVRIDGTVRVCDVFPFQSADLETLEQVVQRLGRSCVLDASRAHRQAEATSEMAIEWPPEEQVAGKDLIGEFLKVAEWDT